MMFIAGLHAQSLQKAQLYDCAADDTDFRSFSRKTIACLWGVFPLPHRFCLGALATMQLNRIMYDASLCWQSSHQETQVLCPTSVKCQSLGCRELSALVLHRRWL